MIAKAKRVTDVRAMEVLARQGMSLEETEFYEDFSPEKPNIKTYRHIPTGQMVAVVRSAPRVIDGQRMGRQWDQISNVPKVYKGRFNGFLALAHHTGKTTVARGKASATWNPVVTLGGVVVKPVFVGLVAREPGYQEEDLWNVLEWRYGDWMVRRLCLRYGRVADEFEVLRNPGAEIRVENGWATNKLDAYWAKPWIGVRKADASLAQLELGRKALPTELLDRATYPFSFDDTVEYTPSADGYMTEHHTTWSNTRSGGGALSSSSASSLTVGADFADETEYWIYRGAMSFDTSGLTAGATVSAVELHMNLVSATSEDHTATTHVVDFSATSIIAANFGQCSYTSWGSYAGTTTGWRAIALDADGKAEINKTGTTWYGLIGYHDQANHAPVATKTSVHYWSAVESANDPHLYITYTMPWPNTFNGILLPSSVLGIAGTELATALGI